MRHVVPCCESCCASLTATLALQAEAAAVANASGAGDCLVAGAAAALLRGESPEAALAHGMVRSSTLLTASCPWR